ncbi:MAG: hypothetical protein C4523_07375 [Myxococcales bacterium]|nr:MAG: hypothetical protein C4523_07375 [Myxococcales bacterium]
MKRLTLGFVALCVCAAALAALPGCEGENKPSENGADSDEEDSDADPPDVGFADFPVGTGSGDGNPAIIYVAFDATGEVGRRAHWTHGELTVSGVFFSISPSCDTTQGVALSSTDGEVTFPLTTPEMMRLAIYPPVDAAFCSFDLTLAATTPFRLEGTLDDGRDIEVVLDLGGRLRFRPDSDHLFYRNGEIFHWLAVLDLGEFDISDIGGKLGVDSNDIRLDVIRVDAEHNTGLAGLIADRLLNAFILVNDADADGHADPDDFEAENRLATGANVNAGSAASLCMDPEEVDFGEISVVLRREQEITFCQCGVPEPVRVLSIALQSETPDKFSFVWSETLPVRLLPGECFRVMIAYEPSTAGPDAAQLVVITDAVMSGGGGLFSVPIGALVRADIEQMSLTCDQADGGVADAELHPFGQVPLGGIATATCRVGNSNAAAVYVETISLEENEGYEFSLHADAASGAWLFGSQEAVFEVDFRPRDRIRRENAIIARIRTGDDEPKERRYSLRGMGVAPELRLDPFPSYAFGNVPVGACATQLIEIANVGALFLEVASADLQDEAGGVFDLDLDPPPDTDDVDNLPASLGSEESATIALSCCPGERGSYAAMLEIRSNSLLVDPTYTYLPVTCTGVDGARRGEISPQPSPPTERATGGEAGGRL